MKARWRAVLRRGFDELILVVWAEDHAGACQLVQQALLDQPGFVFCRITKA
jgi:hypothetical protein